MSSTSHRKHKFKEKSHFYSTNKKDKINYFLSHLTDDVYEIVVFQNGETRYIYSSIVKVDKENHKIKLGNSEVLDIFSLIDVNIS